jgi:DNA-binding HxlR family transcriptional regulator
MRKKTRRGPAACRSHCPISYVLDFVGDRWTLLVLRDLILAHKRHFQQFLESPEGIASNILASRLRQLEAAGLVTRTRDPAHARRVVYAPTDKALDLLPTMLEMVRWGARHDPQTDAPAHVLEGVARDLHGFAAQVRSQHRPAAGRPRGARGAATR